MDCIHLRAIACAWKKAVLLSPSLTALNFARCFQYAAAGEAREPICHSSAGAPEFHAQKDSDLPPKCQKVR